MKICVLVKAVPDAAAPVRLLPDSGRVDRSGETDLNPFDAHALEAAVRLREGGELPVDEIVAVTMGPESAAQALQKALSLGADRSLQLTDPRLEGSDVVGTGHALAAVLQPEAPDLVLLGAQSRDGECGVLATVVAEHLRMPALTQVVKLEVADDDGRVGDNTPALLLERQAEYGYDTVRVPLPAVIAVADTLNEPRYRSLKAIMAARRKPQEVLTLSDVGLDPALVGEAGALVSCGEHREPAARPAGTVVTDTDPDATVALMLTWLQERKLI